MKRFLLQFLLVIFAVNFATAQCDNVTSPGSIAADQTVCADNPNAAPIISIELPDGGSGDLEFLWISTIQDPSATTTVWFPIAGSTQADYDPGIIAQTTYFRRCSRRAGCTEYLGESNIIVVVYEEECSFDCGLFQVTVESISSVNCDGSGGEVFFSIIDAAQPLTYLLNGEIVAGIPNSFAAGDYNLIITDANGCTEMEVFTVPAAENTLAVVGDTENANCLSTNGTITLTIDGGQMPYSTLWNDGSTDFNRTDLAAGIYTVTVTDANGCSIAKSFSLSADQIDLDFTLNTTDATCGSNDGGADISVINGTAPFSILLNGMEASNLNALAAGDYTVDITDANGCTGSDSFTVNELESDVTITATTTNPTCDAASGSIALTLTGGTGNISVLWEDNSTDSERTDLATGTYTVIATDANGCAAIESFTLNANDSDLTADLTINDVSCNGGNDGNATVDITGGTAPYVLTLGETVVSELTDLTAGDYNLNITDALGCAVEIAFTIGQAPLLMIDANVQNPTCGAANGSIELILSGGTGNYTIVWDDNASNSLIRSDLAPGTYSLSVKDENNCVISTEFTLEDNGIGLLSAITITNISCNGENDGAATITISGGTEPFAFLLNGDVVADLNNLSAGSYTLETTDAAGCSVTDNFTINNPTEIEISGTVSPAFCGENNGNISLDITGGTLATDENYSIVWNTGNGTNLDAGTYIVTVTDANNCSSAMTFIVPNENASDLSIITLTTQASCAENADGTASISVTGGILPYTFFLNGEFIEELPTTYAVGDYTVLVNDATGCSTEKVFSIVAAPVITLNSTIQNVDCNNSGSINLAINEGTAPYTFVWSTGDTSEDLSNIDSGEYFVTVTDSNGCNVSNTEAYTVTEETDALVISANISAIACFGDADAQVDFTITGGIAPFIYVLNGTEISELPTAFAPGTYELIATATNGCSGNTTFEIIEPTAISFSAELAQIGCNLNSSINLSVTGGTAPYTYLWSNAATNEDLANIEAGTYTVTITDAQGCTTNNDNAPYIITEDTDLTLTGSSTATSCGADNGTISITVSQGTQPYQIDWSDGLTDVVLRTDLAAGNYAVTITDATGCIATEAFQIESSILFTVNVTAGMSSCNGSDDGAINMNFTGGTPPFSYILNGENFDNLPLTLPAGSYQLQVFDGGGCSDLTEFTVGEPDEIIYLAELTDAICPGDAAVIDFITVVGGSGIYTYLWNDGATTLNRDDLADGTYILTITDSNGCTAISEPFIAHVPEPIIISADEGDFQNISCNNANDGAINVTVTGGTPPYSYFWSNGATTEDLTDLAAGDYLLQLSDAHGCSAVFLAFIANPDPLTASPITTNASCMMSDGTAFIWPEGGTEPYSYAWESGETTAEVTDLAPGMYKVTVSDFGMCQFIIDVVIEEEDCLNDETGAEFNFVMAEATADLSNNSIEVHWMTEAEAIESFFIIQHSQDNETFNDISGLLPGEGATQTQNEYYNMCSEMALGTHFFRIRYVDAFGNLRTSETVTTELIPDNQTEFSVFPNPTSDEFRIGFLLPLEVPAFIQVVNIQGSILEEITAPIGTLHQTIDLRRYNPGVYYVLVKKEGYRRFAKRVVRN